MKEVSIIIQHSIDQCSKIIIFIIVFVVVISVIFLPLTCSSIIYWNFFFVIIVIILFILVRHLSLVHQSSLSWRQDSLRIVFVGIKMSIFFSVFTNCNQSLLRYLFALELLVSLIILLSSFGIILSSFQKTSHQFFVLGHLVKCFSYLFQHHQVRVVRIQLKEVA